MEKLLEFILLYLSIWLALIVLAISLIVYFYRKNKLAGLPAKQNKAYLKFGLFISAMLMLFAVARWIQLPILPGPWLYAAGMSFLALPVLDWYLTKLALKYGAIEANPAMSFLISKIGIDNVIMVILPLVAVAAAVTLSMMTAYFLSLVAIYVFIVVNNSIALQKAKRSFIKRS